jgi:hypothetical protein
MSVRRRTGVGAEQLTIAGAVNEKNEIVRAATVKIEAVRREDQ